ncbi:Uncharacterised protein [Prevotella melaninogenica]|uniref:DUF4350 domain-containing protein n=1 Tax=Prevotella melaninogenica TaxID=28132 RepID=UPI001959338B|nr:DUF4350 domain-containing protein [Prevotella melaninogenica]VTY10078.1 Uncharacterised protein [Prevotella melaninogenica]
MNKRFWFFVAGFLVFVFLLEWNAPSKFVWEPTFNHYDKQPFGCAVFDSLMEKSVPAGYEVTKKTIAQLERDGYGKKPHAFLIQTDRFSPSATDIRSLDRLLRAGNKVFIAASDIEPDSLYPDLQISIYGQNGFSPMEVKSSIANQSIPYDTLVFPRQLPYQEKEYHVYSAMTGNSVAVDGNVTCDTLLSGWVPKEYSDSTEGYWVPRVVKIKRGKGEFFVSCDPLLMTNYGILDTQINGFIFRLMSQFRGLPIVRTEAYGPETEYETDTPLRFWLQNEPLRWAIYLTLGGLLLFCMFYARRRQRVIPVVEEPANRSLEFVKLIGTLYHQKHINRDLLQKKYSYFAETLRRMTMIDVEDVESRKENIAQIAIRTGMPEAEVRMILDRVERYLQGNDELKDAALRKAIDGMDMIINKL